MEFTVCSIHVASPFSNPPHRRASLSVRGQLARFEFLNYDAAAVDSAHQRHKGTYINDVNTEWGEFLLTDSEQY